MVNHSLDCYTGPSWWLWEYSPTATRMGLRSSLACSGCETWPPVDFGGSLQWRHNEHTGVSNYRRPDCLLNRLFRRRSKKTSKLRVTDLCKGNSPVTSVFPSQRPTDAENVSVWWRHHVTGLNTGWGMPRSQKFCTYVTNGNGLGFSKVTPCIA